MMNFRLVMGVFGTFLLSASCAMAQTVSIVRVGGKTVLSAAEKAKDTSTKVLRQGDSVPLDQNVWSGGSMEILVDGHTLVRTSPKSMFKIVKTNVKGKGAANSGTLVSVFLYQGQAQSITDPRYLPAKTKFALVTKDKVATTVNGGLTAKSM